ncbi:Stk1 family PASTA domain-containing Ser/Thr kinase [Arthrobacter glacialis]|uniref:Stk1 family PASTA domain-containing Ser/Thr kinase n=1 Tax=Arthrobacter glacialis TaxID=1664 RepID=UPI000CD415D5|nr:Stk1 family PASTA domain-containing Ser/Thr kinase [Arthrobacter glacialis]POH58209.1 serine/threonine protein kinase [Arthrobacter glacialis]
MQDPAADPLIGSTVDERYLVLSKVAHGGMSTVYLAKDLRLHRNIALKILHPHLATDAAFIARLQREAQSAASLSHPHVVQIHDHGVGPQHAYLVFEFIDGYTLRDVINQRGALSPRQALDLLDPVVEGLAAAHNASLVHRDVKPENVLISRQGWVKIGDFGLSRAVTTNTNTGTLLGTVGYIAPELAQGHNGDARSDIYSAGIMLYELLTGVQPFRGTVPVAVVMAHIQDDVPAPSLAIAGLPPVMDELVRYMTEKDPDHRPANGAALLEDLRHIRQTLTPAELDFGGTPLGQRPVVGSNANTEAISQATSAIHNDATSVIAAPNFPTSVLPPSSRLYTEDSRTDMYDAGNTSAAHIGASSYAQAGDGTSAPALSKRQASADAKARAKAAATPQIVLGPKNPRRRALLWSLLVVLLFVVVAVAGWFLALGPGALSTVPDVHNKTVAQAQELLQAQGFELLPTSNVFDEKVAAGFVVATDPGAGESIRKFQSVTLKVSAGPVLYKVPAVTGQALDAAQTLLTDGQLAVGTVTETFDEKVPAGVVLSQDPATGKEFRANTKVNLVVSKGPEPIPVPALAGKTEADAVAALKAVGLVAAIAPERVNSLTVRTGSVVSQSPDAGNLKAGDTVTLTLSKGPRMITVPNQVGKQVDAATKALEDLGFKVSVEKLLGGFFGTVRFQTPDGGQAPEGSTIVLQVI